MIRFIQSWDTKGGPINLPESHWTG